MKKTASPVTEGRFFYKSGIRSLFRFGLFCVTGNFPGLDAGSTDLELFWRTVNLGANRLKVRVPASFGSILGVRNRVAYRRFLSAYFASFGHFPTCLSISKSYIKPISEYVKRFFTIFPLSIISARYRLFSTLRINQADYNFIIGG